MAEFRSSVDICNRALQMIGSKRITALTDDSKAASECAFAYDKLRQAELRGNLWTFATRRAILRAIDTTTLRIRPPAWSASTYYQPGDMVGSSSDAYSIWQTNVPWNFNLNPATDGAWDYYFGPLTVSEYDSTTTYNAGELVYIQGSVAGLASIYYALETNDDDPTTVETWSATTTYRRGQSVRYLGTDYLSTVDLNLNYTPASTLALWSATTTYAINSQVITTDGRIYTSVAGGNLNHQPSVSDATYWTVAASPPYVQPWVSHTGGVGALTWQYIGNGISLELSSPNIIYPVGTGPATQSGSSNVYMLPNGFLKKAPSDPKSGSSSFLGAPSGSAYSDWNIENGLIVSRDVGPLLIRFVADVTNVAFMDPLFCEGLAARIGLSLCETLTQSSEKVATCAALYKDIIRAARAKNAIEVGASEFPTDDYINCRM